MSFARLRPLFASSSFRLSVIYAAILVGAFVLAATATLIASEAAAQNEIRERVRLEMDALQQEMRTEGLAAAIAAIRTRAENPGSLEYQLISGDGRALVNELGIEAPRPGWSLVKSQQSEIGEAETETFLVLTERNPDGGLLAIGDDLDRAERVRGGILRTLLWVGIGALALALLAGAVATRATLRRMDVLSQTMARIGAGDLSARAPAHGGDDVAQLGRTVNDMLSRLQLLVANVRRVSTDIAHDLRTPLTRVRQQLEHAAHASDLTSAQDAVQKAQTEIDDILRAFRAMLRLAEIDSGAARARFVQVDLASLIERVADAYRPDIEAGGRTLMVGPIEPAMTTGDADLLAQAIGNLIENAMRHTPPDAAITLRIYAGHETIGLEVEDNGHGIPEADRERALEPFVRLDPSRASAGAGLGLGIVNAIARLHSARLTLEDAGPGLKAVITLPDPQH